MKMYAMFLVGFSLICSATFAAESYPAPQKEEMEASVLRHQIAEMEGCVIETAINHVSDIEKQDDNTWSVMCGHFFGSNPGGSMKVIVPDEGIELFKKMARGSGHQQVTNKKDIYILIEDGIAKALGTRYSKSKNLYKW